jgi:hypothetical protein
MHSPPMRDVGWIKMALQILNNPDQCCGSGSDTGSTCFWASWNWNRIHLVRGMDPDPDLSVIKQK